MQHLHNTATPILRAFAPVLLLALSTIFGARPLVAAEPSTAATELSASDFVDLQTLASKILAEHPADRSPQDLNSFAEAEYLLYANKPDNQKLKTLSSALRKVWAESASIRDQAEYFESAATKFNITTLDEAADLASATHQKNALFSFDYAARLLRVGQSHAAIEAVAAVSPSATFSTNEDIGLRDLLVELAADKHRPEEQIAPTIWKIYSSSEWVDLFYMTDLIRSTRFDHSSPNKTHASQIMTVRIAAAQYLLEKAPLLRDELIGKECLGELRFETKNWLTSSLLATQESAQKYAQDIEATAITQKRLDKIVAQYVRVTEPLDPQLIIDMIKNGQIQTLRKKFEILDAK